MLTRQEFGDEGLFYGQRNAFFDYAGVKTNKQRFLFPSFEHGPDLRENVNEHLYNSLNHSYVFASDYKKELIHETRPYAPVYDIGSYVLYAEGYYDNNKLAQIKKEFGKTVLLFPAHTFEGASIEFDKEAFVKKVMNRFKDDFNTILISVYWNDVDDPVYDLFEKEGAKLVSAGFRGDSKFIYRLRTMLDLSDIVASNLLGSYIGYALSLKKPFYMFDNMAILKTNNHIDDAAYIELQEKIKYAFSTITPNNEQKRIQLDIYDKYWGGDKAFKSKEQAKTIISLQEKLLIASKGTSKGYEIAIKNALDKKIYLTESEYRLLQYSLGLGDDK